MAWTKQTARKDTGGKLLAMARGKKDPKTDPKIGRSANRKVVLEYSSDEDPQPAEGAGAPKHVKKQIHLTLPTSPAHVTMTESFTAFFINHGLTQPLQKAFAKRGWSTDQMGEFVANFQKKHGKKVPMPKIYRDEDSSDSEGLELADGTKVGKKATGSVGGSGGSKTPKKPTTSTSKGDSPSTSGTGGTRSGDPVQGRKRGRDGDGDDLNKCRKTGGGDGPPAPVVAHKEPRKAGTVYPPINRRLPVLYISRPKERTLLGYRVLAWTEEQKRKIHEARMQGRLVKPHRYRAGTAALRDIRHYQGNHGAAHQKVTFPEVGEGDRPGFQDRPVIPVGSNTVPPGGIRGVPCEDVRRCQPVCHPRQASYHHAEGYPVGQMNLRRAGVESHRHKNTNILVLFRTTPYSKRSSL